MTDDDALLEGKIYNLICEKQIEKCTAITKERIVAATKDLVTTKAISRFVYGALIAVLANVLTVIIITINVNSAFKDVRFDAAVAKKQAELADVKIESLGKSIEIDNRTSYERYAKLDKKIDLLIALKGGIKWQQ